MCVCVCCVTWLMLVKPTCLYQALQLTTSVIHTSVHRYPDVRDDYREFMENFMLKPMTLLCKFILCPWNGSINIKTYKNHYESHGCEPLLVPNSIAAHDLLSLKIRYTNFILF